MVILNAMAIAMVSLEVAISHSGVDRGSTRISTSLYSYCLETCLEMERLHASHPVIPELLCG